MGKLIAINSKNSEQGEVTNSGKAYCLLCGYEWVTVAPAGVVYIECPSCKSVKGVFRFACERKELHWVCNCKNELFKVTPDGYYCPNCGEWQKGF